MDGQQKNQLNIKQLLNEFPQMAIQIIAKPGDFFGKMPKSGGFLPPLLFVITLSLVSGLIVTILSLLRILPQGDMAKFVGLAAFILVPATAAVFSFLWAAILFVIWKIMGSQEPYETAYRGMAYTAAIMPITTILDFIPYLGSIIGLAWLMYLLVIVSIKVQSIKAKTAWVGFGVIFALLAFASVGAEIASRRISRQVRQLEELRLEDLRHLEIFREDSSEEAGRALGDLLRGLRDSMEEEGR